MGWSARKRWQDEVQDRITHQISELRRDVSSLGKAIAHQGRPQHDVADIGGAIWHGGEMVAEQIGHEAQRFGKAIRQDPMPAIVGAVALVGVVAALSLAFAARR